MHTAANEQPPESVAGRESADIVVGVGAGGDELELLHHAELVDAQLERAFPSRSRIVVRLTRRSGRVHAAPVRRAAPTAMEADDELTLLLRVADALAAPAVALVSPLARADDGAWLRNLLGPLLDEGYDVVCPSYARRPFEGAIQSGVALPLTRALFGVRLFQPIGREVAFSLRAARQLLADGTWLDEIARDGPDLWLASPALGSGLRPCQVCLGPRSVRAAPPAQPVSASLAHVLTVLFRGIERHAPEWQHVNGSAPIPCFGEKPWIMGGPTPVDPGSLDAFQLAYRELAGVWRAALAPATLLALQRTAAAPAAKFRLEDGVWAHALYDLALGWHFQAMDRTQLLLSAAPLYLAWFAGFARDVAASDPEQVDARIEALCGEFERSKRYLVARWRWPDPFAP